MFVICIKGIIYLLLHNLHDCTVNQFVIRFKTHFKRIFVAMKESLNLLDSLIKLLIFLIVAKFVWLYLFEKYGDLIVFVTYCSCFYNVSYLLLLTLKQVLLEQFIYVTSIYICYFSLYSKKVVLIQWIVQSIVVSAVRRRRDIKTLLCLSAPVPKSLI